MSCKAYVPCRYHSFQVNLFYLLCKVSHWQSSRCYIFVKTRPYFWVSSSYSTCKTVSWSNNIKEQNEMGVSVCVQSQNFQFSCFSFPSLPVELFHQLSQALEVLTDAAAKVKPLIAPNLHLYCVCVYIYKCIYTRTKRHSSSWCLILFSGRLW